MIWRKEHTVNEVPIIVNMRNCEIWTASYSCTIQFDFA